ncbi:MAG: hypothetical protein ABL907_22870, partial [Hyphomicrobium sp.]
MLDQLEIAMPVTLDYSQSYKGVTSTLAFYAPFRGFGIPGFEARPTTGLSSMTVRFSYEQLVVAEDGTVSTTVQSFDQVVDAEGARYYNKPGVTPYLPGTDYFYKIGDDIGYGLKVYAAVPEFPKITDYIQSSYFSANQDYTQY